jgi:hypothetical protein
MALRVLPVLLLLTATVVAAAPTGEELIDHYIFGKMERDRVTPAPPADDAEFLRRIYLDLTGRLPEPETARKFLANNDPDKRRKLIRSLFPPLPVTSMRSISTDPFLDRWTYFFNDLFRNGQLLQEGINTFYDYVYKSLLLAVPYDEMVRDMITATAVSTWTNGAANFIARSHVFEGDGYIINHEDTADEIAINTTKLFLGVNMECISCHDGRAHLEKINLWLTRHKRADLYRQASFFGKTFIAPVFGRFPQFMVKDTRRGYELSSRSALRPVRNTKEDVTPTFVLDGARPQAGERDREAYARMITSHPQFARATVNLIWAELMGQGIVDPPLDFDLDRQDPKNPPPAPWTIQPSHPELLDALAADFREHGYNLRRLIRLIVSSRAYQLSSNYPGKWKDSYESYFARRIVRRLSAEQTWDAVSQVTGNFPTFKVAYADKRVRYISQTHSPQDVERSLPPLYKVLQAFGQCDRYTTEANRRPGMIQSALLLNDKALRERVKTQPGSRLEALLRGDAPRPYEEVVDELFWAALSRPPSPDERKIGLELIAEHREAGAEDLTWALINRLDFLFY